jgi:hypothetical protein
MTTHKPKRDSKPNPDGKPKPTASPLIEWPIKEELQPAPVTKHKVQTCDGEISHVETEH